MSDKVLVLRNCRPDMTSYEGFQWPSSGLVEAPDWDPAPRCGNGLHGWLWGEGDGSLGFADQHPTDAKWLVLEVEASATVELQGKVKFPRAVVAHCGDRLSATEYLAANGGTGRAIIGGTSTSGDGGTSTSGYRGTSTSGDRGTSTSGYGGTSTSGDGGTSTSGEGGIIQVTWWDEAAQRKRVATGYIGEKGLLPNTPYRWIDGKWAAVEMKATP